MIPVLVITPRDIIVFGIIAFVGLFLLYLVIQDWIIKLTHRKK